MTAETGKYNRSLLQDVELELPTSDRPLVSIVIGSYNRRRFLEQAIESIRATYAT